LDTVRVVLRPKRYESLAISEARHSMPDLLYEKRDAVAVITLNRPEKRNAFSPEMLVRLADAWVDFRDDDALRVAVLTGAGDDAFCAGGDLGRLMPLFTGARVPEDDWDHRLMSDVARIMSTALLRPFELYKPIVAAINGFALAGGSEILQSTDIRVASSQSTFGLSEAQRGLVPGGGSMVRLPRQIPHCKAMEILLTGDWISAREAYRIGLVNEVVAPEEVLPRAFEFAQRLAKNAPIALRTIKEAVLRTSGLPLEDAYRIEFELSAVVTGSKDAREGPKAFMEKREPVFTGE
jgi:enoyl-CoA hydratase/carnithine racemase